MESCLLLLGCGSVGRAAVLYPACSSLNSGNPDFDAPRELFVVLMITVNILKESDAMFVIMISTKIKRLFKGMKSF